MKSTVKKLAELEYLIGGTPLAEITFKYEGKTRKIFAKLEYYNFSGSIKDRMALNCIIRAYQSGGIKEGMEIAETTSGNTGISFAAIGAYLGHEVFIFMPDWMSKERESILLSYGAKLNLISKEDGGFLSCIEKTKEFAKKGNVYLPDQFANKYNTQAHYTSTGPEIFKQMDKLSERIDAVTAGVGTGATVMGIGRYLKSISPNIKVFPAEPESSPILTTGHQSGSHRIAGISDEFVPDIINLNECDGIIQADDGDSIIMAQKLAKELGLGVGISSGANFIAAIKAADLTGEGANVVTVFADDNKKYLSTDYVKEEPVKPNFISSKVELLDFCTVK